MPTHDVYSRLRTLLAPSAFVIFVLLVLCIPAGNAQDLLPPSEIPTVNQLIDSKTSHNSLKCEVHPFSPFLDFNSRHEAGLLLSTGLNQFRFGEQVVTYLRITPDGASPCSSEALSDSPRPRQA